MGKLLHLTTSQVLPFISSADEPSGKPVTELLPPKKLERAFNLVLPEGDGRGEAGLEETVRKVLKYSVNTWNSGFMDKLYASTDPVGIASDLLLGVLNTNVSSCVLSFLRFRGLMCGSLRSMCIKVGHAQPPSMTGGARF
jgi:hypothetical protein